MQFYSLLIRLLSYVQNFLQSLTTSSSLRPKFSTVSYYVLLLTSKIFYSLLLRPPPYVQNFLQSLTTSSFLRPKFSTVFFYVFPLTSRIFYSLLLRPLSYVQNFLQSFSTSSLLRPKFSSLLLRPPSYTQNFLQSLTTYSLLRPNVFVNNLLSSTLKSMFFLKYVYHVSRPYKAVHKIIVMYTSSVCFSKAEGKPKFLN